jgi:hypothetical protein
MVGVAPRHKESQVMMERELNFYSKKMEAFCFAGAGN